jgi:dihydroorotate dehydrogenase (fumarate)
MNTPAPDISTTYLGLSLRSPLIPSASPLSEHLDSLLEMENCGAGAVVLHSLFEDPYEKHPRHPDHYLDEIHAAREALTIPVIASLNGTTLEGWINYACRIEQAGADALELNVYNLSLDPKVSSAQVETSYVEVVKAVRQATALPLAVKLPPFFTNLSRMIAKLDDAGADGVVLFNRVYQPDIDLDTMGPRFSLRLSMAAENRLPLRWLSLLYRQAHLDFAAGTGIRSGADVLKMILCGASATQLCSVLLQRGIPWLMEIREELEQRMENCHIASLQDARGSLSRASAGTPEAIEREEYRKALQGYSLIDVPSWRDEVPLHAAPGRSAPVDLAGAVKAAPRSP